MRNQENYTMNCFVELLRPYMHWNSPQDGKSMKLSGFAPDSVTLHLNYGGILSLTLKVN